MLFNSLEFLMFFPIVVLLYFVCTHKYRWILLLAASYYFYMAWKPEYIILIIISTVIDYSAGLLMGRESNKKKRKKYLYMSLLTNLGLLFTFKYFNFFSSSIYSLLEGIGIQYAPASFNIILPMGISFYTFQTLSYTIDVYRGRIESEKHFGIFALYVTFFPQLVAGPIERSDRLLPQFKKEMDFDYNRMILGLERMGIGFFKKIVIGDRLAIMVNAIYNYPLEHNGLQFLLATFAFSFQIYCDFSGYSDIAIGLAKILGYDLMENFNRPYFSKTISEFWSRWHISLSSWFKDYVYISLGGNKVVKIKVLRNLLITFLISGLWHGANWTFVIWGGLHGMFLIIEKVTVDFREDIINKYHVNKKSVLYKVPRIMLNYLLVCFTWIFFRAGSVSEAFYIIKMIGNDSVNWLNPNHVTTSLKGLALNEWWIIISIFSLILMFLYHMFERKQSIHLWLQNKHIFIRWSIYYLVIGYILILGTFTSQEFIYFQF